MTYPQHIIRKAPPNHWRYNFNAPEGQWRGRLDYLRWGKRANLLLYFTDIDNGNKHILSVCSSNGYKARDGATPFRYQRPGTTFRLVTRRSRQGRARLHEAARLHSVTKGSAAPAVTTRILQGMLRTEASQAFRAA